MNEQLRKAIAEATNVPVFQTGHNKFGAYEIAVNRNDHHASQAKLLRVIELLVEQRNKWIKSSDFSILNQDKLDDAELIAALEGGDVITHAGSYKLSTPIPVKAGEKPIFAEGGLKVTMDDE